MRFSKVRYGDVTTGNLETIELDPEQRYSIKTVKSGDNWGVGLFIPRLNIEPSFTEILKPVSIDSVFTLCEAGDEEEARLWAIGQDLDLGESIETHNRFMFRPENGFHVQAQFYLGRMYVFVSDLRIIPSLF